MAGKPRLTPKQDHFARVYVETGNASEAYRQAYNVRPDTKPTAIWVNGCKALGNANVAQRVAELQATLQKRTMVTVETITKELEEASILAMSDEKGASAAVSAAMGKAKLHGLLVDKVQSDVSITIDKDDADL